MDNYEMRLKTGGYRLSSRQEDDKAISRFVIGDEEFFYKRYVRFGNAGNPLHQEILFGEACGTPQDARSTGPCVLNAL